MKGEIIRNTYALSPAAVDEISAFVQDYCAGAKIDRKLISRFRLTLEELLLQWMDRCGEGVPVTLVTGRRLGKYVLSLEIEGEAFDPFQTEQDAIGGFSAGMLRSLSLSPEYSYRGGLNIFSFKLRRKQKNPLITLLISLVCAVIFGNLGMLMPDGLRTALLDSFITPINDTFLNVLGCAAGPMIFLSVAWGIYGIGDTTTLSRIGKRMIGSFIGTLFLLVAILGCAMLPFFHLSFAGGIRSSGGLESVFQMLLNIFPKNIFSPFIDGNSLQIIFLGFLIGIAMLFLGKRTEVVALAVEQINYIVQFLVEFISKLVPYFIFIAIVRFIWSGTINTLFSVSKFFLIFIGAVLTMALILVIYTAIRLKANPFMLIRKGLPTLLIAITTASSAASFGTNMTACEKSYGINQSVSSFGIPLGMVMYKPTTAIGFLGFALFFAEMYQVQCSLGWLLMAFIITTILAVATPPIPGGALTAYTIIFMMLDIPNEALAIALAIDVLVDFIDTGFDQFVLPFVLVNQASRIGRINLDILREK